MAAEGLSIQVSYPGPGGTLLLTDIHDGFDARNQRVNSQRPGPIYISPGQTIELVLTGSVALSFESGVLRSYIDRGILTATFVVGTAAGEVLGGGVISGTNQALGNPADAGELATFLDSNYQPTYPTETSSYTIYVRTGGDDDANDGTTEPTAFASVERALQKIATLNNGNSTATIDLGPGAFTIPRVLATNYTDFQGTLSVEDTLTINAGGVIAADDTDGIVLDVTSTGGPYTADQLRGRRIIWTSGTSNGNPGWIYRNEATVGGVTRIYASHDSGPNTGIQSMVAGDTIDLLLQETLLNLTGATILMNSVQMNFRDVVFSGVSVGNLLCLTTDKVEFSRCKFDGGTNNLRIFQTGGFGRAFLTCCYMATAGNTGASFLRVRNNGYLQIDRGTVLDADLHTPATATARQVSGAAGSLLAFQGHIVCRGFDQGTIFQIDGLGVFGVGGINSWDNILVEDENGTNTYQVGPVFEVNSTGEGQGGWYQLPNLQGSITSDYSVEARNSGSVIVGSGSTGVTTNLGTNTVSADGGISNVAVGSDLALIENGVPAFSGFAARYHTSFVSADLSAGVLTVNHNLGQQYVTVTVYNNSGVSVAPDSVTATNAQSCDVDLTSQGVLTGTWNVVVSG